MLPVNLESMAQQAAAMLKPRCEKRELVHLSGEQIIGLRDLHPHLLRIRPTRTPPFSPALSMVLAADTRPVWTLAA